MRNFIVLLLAVLALGTTACNHEEIPYEIWVDSAFTPDETEAVIEAVDEWNETAAKHGLRAFTLKGTLTDSYSKKGDGHDERRIVYRASREAVGESVGTLGLAAANDDALIFADDIALYAAPDDYLPAIRRITLHELGHVLGLVHSDDPKDVMAHGVVSDHLTEEDIEQFCIANSC